MRVSTIVHLRDEDAIEVNGSPDGRSRWIDVVGGDLGVFASSATLRRLASACVELANSQDGVLRAPSWWIWTGAPHEPESKRLLGPFESRHLAMLVRAYVEKAEHPTTYWVEPA